MAALLLVAHAPLASAMHAVAAHVYPEAAARMAVIDVAADETVDAVQARVAQALSTLAQQTSGGEVLLLADVFGATPCNAALAAADGRPARVVAGLNVPMLWRAVCYGDRPLDELVARAVAGASQGVMQVAVPRRQVQATPGGRRDQVHDHHQQ
jgi:PTS system ascorbate-specific IIA component